MPAITVDQTRPIVHDFAAEIKRRKTPGPKPSKEVIHFRNERRDGIERQVVHVPIGLLRYRKDNGRIASDVMDYERTVGVLHETDAECQQLLGQFLEEKDPERTAVLRKSILHIGQDQPAIITCDGFLINGNRRKVVLERLHREHPNNESFKFMKCVILPGEDDEGGSPTIIEIEQIENRYQLQSDGKSEYYGFDRALSIKRKMQIGLSLEQQLRDDPQYAEATNAQIQKAVRQYTREYMRPLQCVDRYLKQFKRQGQYRTISTGMSDPEGRWQAFRDFAHSYDRYFKNDKRRLELGIDEDEIGAIEEAAFNIIRLRVIPDMSTKVHVIMRNLPKYCGTAEAKKHILKIAEEVEPVLPKSETVDPSGKPLSTDEVDAKWATKYKQPITYRLHKASHRHEVKKERETPLELLDAAYKKLTHDGMDLTTIAIADYKKARDTATAIEDRADEIKRELYTLEKSYKKLNAKKS